MSGCLPQRFREELPKLLPEVDAFMGIDQVAQVTEIVQQALSHRAERLKSLKSKVQSPKAAIVGRFAEIEKGRGDTAHETEERIRGTEKFGKTRKVIAPNSAANTEAPSAAPLMNVNARPVYIPDFATPRFRLTPRHFAYVKIAEGCNHPCSFCIIPRMRGSHRSRPQSDIVQEARQLIADGVKELNLISQDSTYYGLDLRPNQSRDHRVAGKIQRRRQIIARRCGHALHPAARTERACPAIFGFGCFTPIPRIGRMN